MSYAPDCADCPTPMICKDRNDCGVLRQIRHGHEGTVYCHECSKAGGGERPIYHAPPICVAA